MYTYANIYCGLYTCFIKVNPYLKSEKLKIFKWYEIPQIHTQFIENKNTARSIKLTSKSKTLKANEIL